MPRHDLSVGAWLSAAGVAVAFLTVALASIVLTRETGDVAVFWPANGLLAAVLLRMPRERHLATLALAFAASAAANVLYGDPPGIAVGLAACNMLEAVLVCWLVMSLVGPNFMLADLRQLFVLLTAGLVGPAVSATVTAGLFSSAIGLAPSALWHNWWAGDAVGMVLVLPLVTSFDVHPLKRLIAGPRNRQLFLRMLEFGAAFSLLGGLLWVTVESRAYGSPLLFTPILLWCAFRFGTCAVSAAAVIVVVTAVTTAAHEAWPLPFTPGATVASRVVPLQLFAVLVTVPPLIVAVLIRQRAQVLRRLDDAIDSMADAFALYDAEGRLVICNSRYEYLAPVTDLLKPGVRFEDLVREGTRRGMYTVSDAANAKARITELLRAQNAGLAREISYSDGRWLQVVPRLTADRGTVLVCRDVTERKLLQQTLEHLAMHDPLTDLPNRKMYDLEFRRARARAEREGHRLALMLLDLDQFKEVNDTYGHQVGDQLLVEVARRLVGCARTGDVVARVGGDEFAVLAESSDDGEGFEALAERILSRLSEPVQVGTNDLEPCASIGLTVFPQDPADLNEFIAHADRALYAAKAAGRRTWMVFHDGMTHGNGASRRIAADLGGALERGEFGLDYQPIFATSSGEVIGIEALLRWDHPRRGRLPASCFIGTAERAGAILPLTRFVLRTALRQQRAWQEAGFADVPVWVNLAPACLRWDALIDAVTDELADAGVEPRCLVLEVTEDSFVDLERAEGLVDALRRRGVRLALDDFGAGYSALGRLRALRMDVLKIDRRFISDLAVDERDRAVVQAMVTLGENLGMTPLAEGVETNAQLRILHGLGCVWAQGYLFARPMPPRELTSWLAAREQRRQYNRQNALDKLLTGPGNRCGSAPGRGC